MFVESQHPRDKEGRFTNSFSTINKNRFDTRAGIDDFRTAQDEQLANDPALEGAMRTYLHGGEGGFEEVQALLRGGGEHDAATVIESRMQSFDIVNARTGGDGYVYRGLTSASSLGINTKTGIGSIVEKGLMSTSMSAIEAGNFATQRASGTHVVLRIRPDSSLRSIVGAAPQAEVVFQRGVKLTLQGSPQKVMFDGEHGSRSVVLIDAIAQAE